MLKVFEPAMVVAEINETSAGTDHSFNLSAANTNGLNLDMVQCSWEKGAEFTLEVRNSVGTREFDILKVTPNMDSGTFQLPRSIFITASKILGCTHVSGLDSYNLTVGYHLS